MVGKVGFDTHTIADQAIHPSNGVASAIPPLASGASRSRPDDLAGFNRTLCLPELSHQVVTSTISSILQLSSAIFHHIRVPSTDS